MAAEPSPSAEVSIRLLGGFEVVLGDRVLGADDWPSRRSAELVQLLALAPCHELLRDQVIDRLWPRLDAAAGAANLRKAAHHARAALGDPCGVILQGGRVRLFPDRGVHIDVEEFGTAAAEALDAADPRRCAEVADRWDELLPGSLYEEWTEPTRTRLRDRCAELLRTAGAWERLVALDPTDEPAHRELMRAALAEGRRSDAVRWYGRLREALEEQLGLLPDDDTEALLRSCLPETEELTGLVGRDRELSGIDEVVGQCGSGRIHCLVIRGPAGIGKTALAQEVLRRGRRAGWTVTQTSLTASAAPYGVVASLVGSRLRDQPSAIADLPEGSRVVLAALTPLAGPPEHLDGSPTRHQVTGALRRLLLSGDGPALVVVDDCDLADDASTEVLVQLASSDDPVLVVLTHRPGSTSGVLATGISRLERTGRATTLDLEALEPEAATRLVRRSAPGDLDRDAVATVAELGEGNPFVLVELARAAPLEPRALPDPVAAAVASRLVDLDPVVVGVLERLAVAGGDPDGAVAVALSGLDAPQAGDALDRALEAQVLVVRDGTYRFRHQLVQQVLADRMPPHRRATVHARMAEELEGRDPEPAAVARSWLAAGRPDRAAPWLLAAGHAALSLGSPADALAAVEELLRHQPRHPTGLRLRAEALDLLGDRRALPAYDDAVEVAEPSEADDLRAMRALATIKQGDPPGALDRLQGIHPTSVQGRLAEALAWSGAAALGFADPAVGTAKSAESRRLALETGDTASIVVASWSQAAAAHARGELRDSVLADLRDTSTVPHLAVRVFDGQLCIMQRFLYGARPYDDVIAFADALSAEARRLGAARGHAYGVTLRGEAELLSGRLEEAETHLTLGGRLHRDFGGAVGEAFALQRLSEVALAAGRRDEAADRLAEALDLARVTDIGFHLLDRIYGTRIALAADADEALAAVEDAEASVRGPLETCPGCRITYAFPAAVASARAGDLERAEAYEVAMTFLAEVVMRLPAWYAALEEVRGHLAAAQGDRTGAARRFAVAAEGYAGAGQPLDRDRCAALAGSPVG